MSLNFIGRKHWHGPAYLPGVYKFTTEATPCCRGSIRKSVAASMQRRTENWCRVLNGSISETSIFIFLLLINTVTGQRDSWPTRVFLVYFLIDIQAKAAAMDF